MPHEGCRKWYATWGGLCITTPKKKRAYTEHALETTGGNRIHEIPIHSIHPIHPPNKNLLMDWFEIHPLKTMDGLSPST